MAKRRRLGGPSSSARLPLTMMELALASWETVWRRTMLMGSFTCSPAEYRRMVAEKADALRQTFALATRPGGHPSAAALIAPWHARATANAKRLRRR